jgi:branched-chain amino acid transport system permease protein
VFGSDIYKIDVGMPKDPVIVLGKAASRAASDSPGGPWSRRRRRFGWSRCSRCSSRRQPPAGALRAGPTTTRQAQSDRASADRRIWVIVWSVAGFVALVAGVIWGSKLGVQFSLSLVALKALPVVILGGLTSVPGAIVGGLIIGMGEKLSEVYLGPSWAAASRSGSHTCSLWSSCSCGRRGLFGEKIIDACEGEAT